MMFKIDHHIIFHAVKPIHEITSQQNLFAVNDCKCRAKQSLIAHMNHVSDTVNILSSDIMSGVGTLKCNVSVRVAIDVHEVDAVALLRCRCVTMYDHQLP
jgi:hypothetical protein